MGRTALISVDGHVKASRAGYRDYLEAKHHDVYDEWVKAQEDAGIPDAGNLNGLFTPDAQWDSNRRLETLEGEGIVAEVLFPNGMPFQVNRLDDFGRGDNLELTDAGRRAYNRWLVDFCGQAPGRRAGQMVVSFDDVDQAVEDVHWAKEQGLGGIMMPAVKPGVLYMFDPKLDPIWAAIEEVGLPISQHGGAGLEPYNTPGFATIMTIATEDAFFSNHSLWQMISAGVFDRFPSLRMSFIETQVMFLIPAMNHIHNMLSWGDDWMEWARNMDRERTVQRLPGEYFGTNIFVGISPFTPKQLPLRELLGKDESGEPLPGFHIGAEAAMFGADYPHFESIVPNTKAEAAGLARFPSVTDHDLEAILVGNATKVYDFDLEALQPDIDRVAFELGDVLATAPA